MTGCVYLRVPQKDGSVARVAQTDRRIGAELRRMFTALGGTPVAEVPPEAAARCFAG